jgi:hypothetical protein
MTTTVHDTPLSSSSLLLRRHIGPRLAETCSPYSPVFQVLPTSFENLKDSSIRFWNRPSMQKWASLPLNHRSTTPASLHFLVACPFGVAASLRFEMPHYFVTNRKPFARLVVPLEVLSSLPLYLYCHIVNTSCCIHELLQRQAAANTSCCKDKLLQIRVAAKTHCYKHELLQH